MGRYRGASQAGTTCGQCQERILSVRNRRGMDATDEGVWQHCEHTKSTSGQLLCHESRNICAPKLSEAFLVGGVAYLRSGARVDAAIRGHAEYLML